MIGLVIHLGQAIDEFDAGYLEATDRMSSNLTGISWRKS